MENGLKRSDWLLMFLSPDVLGLNEQRALDPIRIQKGMFLVSMGDAVTGAYNFRPYNWGPFSPEIYSDLGELQSLRLISAEQHPSQSWQNYRATQRGVGKSRELARNVAEDQLRSLKEARQFVTERSFLGLLRDIYGRYPEYATKSLLSENH